MKLTATNWQLLGHIIAVSTCAFLIWLIIDILYTQRGYSASVPEIRYDHDCSAPPHFLFRTVSEDDDPRDLAAYVRVENYTSIIESCTFIDLFLIPHGSEAVTTEGWARRLAETPFFRTHDGAGFALRFLPDQSGQYAPIIKLPGLVHQRSVEHWFLWLQFGPTLRAREAPPAELQFEYATSKRFLVDELRLRGAADGDVFGDIVEVRLAPEQGFVMELLDSGGKYRFALLNVLIGVLASVGTASLTGIGKHFIGANLITSE